jgi:hypothetical protein
MGAVAGVFGDILITSPPSVALAANLVLTDSGDHMTFTNPTASQRYWDDTSVPTVQSQNDEIQQVAITGSPTGGTFTLTWNGQTTSALNWNCTAAQMQTALQALSNIGANNILVTGGPGPGTAFVCEFVAAMGNATRILMTLATNSLTGGVSPSVAITRILAGQSWTLESTPFTLRYVNGAVIFGTPQTGNTQVRLSANGKYFPYASIGNTTDWTANPAVKAVDATTHKGVGGSPFEDYLLTTMGATFTLKKWWINDQVFINAILARTRLIISCVDPQGGRYEAYGYIMDDAIKLATAALVDQAITFQCSGQIYAF